MKTLLILSLVFISSISIAQESIKVEPIVWQFKKGKTIGYLVLNSEMIREDEIIPKDVFDQITNWDIDYFLLNAIKPAYVEAQLWGVIDEEFDYTEYYTEGEIEILTEVLKKMMISGDVELPEAYVTSQIKQLPPILFRGLMELYIYDIGNQHTFMELELHANNKKIEMIPYIGYKLEFEQLKSPISEQIDIIFDLYANKESVFEMASKKRAGYLSGDIVNWKIEDVTEAEAKDIESATKLMENKIPKGVVLVCANEKYMFHENGFYNWLVNNGFKLKCISF